MNKEAKKNQLRVLYFCPSGIYGGAERFIELCMQGHLNQEDVNASMYFLNEGDFLTRSLEAGYECTVCPFPTRLRNLLSWLKFQFHFYKVLKIKKIDVVHFSMPYSQIFGALAARMAGVKIIWFQHGPIGRGIDKIAARFPCDHILFNSEYTREDHIQKVGPLKLIASSIVPMAVNPRFSEKEVKKIRADYDSSYPLFLCCGRICSWKGYEVAIEAIGLLKEKKGVKAHLLIVGRANTKDDMLYLMSLKSLVTKLGLNEQVSFLGFKENIYDYIKAADALLHTSTIPEPYGLVVAEALFLNTFVYTPNHGGPVEIIKANPGQGKVYDLTDQARQLFEAICAPQAIVQPEYTRQNQTQVAEMIDFLRKLYY